MASIVWPDSLPQELRIADHAATFPQGSIRTSMDAGPAKMRRRFTAAPVPHTGSLVMTGDQLATMWAFWTDSLKMGSEEFEWVDPRTGSAAMIRFTEEPRTQPLAPRAATAYWRVLLAIEVMPSAVNPSRPEDVLPPDIELGEWGPWYHAFDPAPAGETDAAFMGTTPDLGIASGGGGDSGGGGISNQAGWGGVPGASSGHVINQF